MLGGAGALRRRRRQRTYARFLDATVRLIDGSTASAPRPARSARIMMGAAILRICEADRAVNLALVTAEPRRLADAAARLDTARAVLAEAGCAASFDAARRRSIRLVRTPV